MSKKSTKREIKRRLRTGDRKKLLKKATVKSYERPADFIREEEVEKVEEVAAENTEETSSEVEANEEE